MFAKIAVGLPVGGPFDYSLPGEMTGKIKPGSRVWVSFGPRRVLGYVVGLVKESKIKKLKPVLELIDEFPLFDKNLLSLTKELADFYCCSWGEAIETAIPEALRKGRKAMSLRVPPEAGRSLPDGQAGNQVFTEVASSPTALRKDARVLIHDLDGQARWDIYLNEIKKNLDNNMSAIVLLPDIPDVFKSKELIMNKLGVTAQLLYRKQPDELEVWVNLKSGGPKVVVGTRSAVFAPLNNLGLIIMEDEGNSVYKQDQVPHYHARDLSLMRARIDNARLILGSRVPSLESFYLSKKKDFQYTLVPRKKEFPMVKLIDTRHLPFHEKSKKLILARLLEDAVYSALNEKGKTLLFLNRKGFATAATCHNCGKALKCPRCNVNLVYHFKEESLNCHYCNFKMPPPKICPECNSGYIKFSGIGTEKIESELSRIFPQARIKVWDDFTSGTQDADIFIATSSVIRHAEINFSLIGVLGIDNTLNRVDFRATEKVSVLLSGLLALTDKLIIIQTGTPSHHCFQALLKKDVNFFYAEELKQRKQLGFPPYKHMVLIKLRGKKEDRVKEAAQALFDKLKKVNLPKSIEIVSVNPSNFGKLRGNFYWQVLLRSSGVSPVNNFLKNNLKDFRHSGIIVTIDVDPI